jgi:hypothetical protein
MKTGSSAKKIARSLSLSFLSFLSLCVYLSLSLSLSVSVSLSLSLSRSLLLFLSLFEFLRSKLATDIQIPTQLKEVFSSERY